MLHSQYQWGQCYHRHQTLWGISLKCRCCAVLTKMLGCSLLTNWCFSWREKHSLPPCVYTNTCWLGIYVASSHASYFITPNITGTWVFHFMHTEPILCSVSWKWQYLGQLKHLHVLFMFIICPFVACLFGHLLLKLCTYLLHCNYSFSQCGCSVLVSIVPGPIWNFFNSTMKESTITNEDAVFSLSVFIVTFRYCTPWFDWPEPNLVLFIWVEDNPMYLNARFRETQVNTALKITTTGQFVLSFNVYSGNE
jgi:hypothetical protein